MSMDMCNYCLKVRYPECDPMGVAYHGSYLPWLELARIDFVKQFGVSYAEMEKRGIFVVVTELNIKYKKSVGYDDSIVILTKVKELQNIRFSFEYEVYKVNFEIIQGGNALTSNQIEEVRKSDLVVVALSHQVFLNSSKKPIRIKREAPDIYKLLTAKPEAFKQDQDRSE